MRLGTRSKIAVHISAWAIAGIVLLTLPGLLAPPTTRSTEAPIIGSDLRGLATPGSYSVTNGNTQPAPGSQPADGRDFLVRLILVLIPAAALSGFVKRRTDRRMRDVWI